MGSAILMHPYTKPAGCWSSADSMTDASAIIVSDLQRALELLVDLGDPAALRTAEALTRWLAGESFETAAGLSPGWRRELQQQTRDIALAALITLHPHSDDKALGRRIADGIKAAPRSGVRPDAESGHYYDLARNDRDIAGRTWRYLVGKARGKLTASVATAALRVWSKSKLETT